MVDRSVSALESRTAFPTRTQVWTRSLGEGLWENAVIAVLVAIPLMIALCILYVSVEHPIYYWDNGYYWTEFQRWGKAIATGQAGWQQELAAAIRTQDYNPSSVVLLYPFYDLFGGSRQSYLIAISLFFVLPAMVVTALLARASGFRSFVGAFVLCLLYVPYWAPAIRGLPDMVGIIFLGLATLLILRSDFLRHRWLTSAILLGILLWLPFLFRRWYAYSVVAFFISAWVLGCLSRWRQDGWRSALVFTVALALSGLIASTLVWSFQADLAYTAIFTDYSEVNAGWQIPFAQHFEIFWQRTGAYSLLAIALGLVVAILQNRLAILFCASSATITFFLFIRTQTIGTHHYLPIAMWLFPIFTLGLQSVMDRMQAIPRRLRIVPFLLLSVVAFLFAFDRDISLPAWAAPLFAEVRYTPLHLDNYDQYRALIASLKKDIGETGDKVMVTASSTVLSDVMLAALDPELADHILPTAHIDAYKQFDFNLLRADYGVGTEPTQIHLAAGTQLSVEVPNQLLTASQGFGAAFQRLGQDFVLDAGVKASIFKRTRPVTIDEMMDLLNRMSARNPEFGQRFANSMALPIAARTAQLGDVYGHADSLGPNAILLHPGVTKPTEVEIPLRAAIAEPRKLTFVMDKPAPGTCADADGVDIAVSYDANLLQSVTVLPGQRVSVSVPRGDGTLRLVVDKRSQPYCDGVRARFDM